MNMIELPDDDEDLEKAVSSICDMGGASEFIEGILSVEYTIDQQGEMEATLDDICDMGGAEEWVRTYLIEHPELYGKAHEPHASPKSGQADTNMKPAHTSPTGTQAQDDIAPPLTPKQILMLTVRYHVPQNVINKLNKWTAMRLIAELRERSNV